MSRYEVVYVGDDDLPANQEWAIVETGAETFLFIKESEVSSELLTRIWRSWQCMDGSGEGRERVAAARVLR